MGHIKRGFIYILLTYCIMVKVSWSCGVNSHLWITDSAICQLPEGSRLKEFYAHQVHVDLTRLGSAFPDSGYAINHPYGETAHWPPFIQTYVTDFHERHGQIESAWTTEAYKEVAFILGVAAHGYEDELFDSLFLRWAEQEDDIGQDIIDPALDFLLIYEGHTELLPPLDFPVSGATSALQRSGIEVSEEEVQTGVARVHQFALRLSQSPQAVGALVERDAPLIPWTTQHYLNQNIVGSLAHEPARIAELLEGLFSRLSGEDISNQVLSHVDPSFPDLLDRGGLIRRDQSQWITLYFRTGVLHESIIENLQLFNQNGQAIPYISRGTRWGGGNGYTRLFELSPSDIPSEDGLNLKIAPGLLLIDGTISTMEFSYQIGLCDDNACEIDTDASLAWGGRQKGCWVIEEESTDQGIHDQGPNDLINDSYIGQVDDTDMSEYPIDLSTPRVEERHDFDHGTEIVMTTHQSSGCSQKRSQYKDTGYKRFYPYLILLILIRHLYLTDLRNRKRFNHDT